jgi:hypothetical protein
MILSDVRNCTVPPLRVESSLSKNLFLQKPTVVNWGSPTRALRSWGVHALIKHSRHRMAFVAVAMVASTAVLGPGDALVVMYNFISSANSKCSTRLELSSRPGSSRVAQRVR